jgi:hypothetical protein
MRADRTIGGCVFGMALACGLIGCSPAGPSPATRSPSSLTTALEGEVPVIDLNGRRFAVQFITTGVIPVTVGSATVISGDVASLEAMAAAYDAGYHLDVHAMVTPACCSDYTAVRMTVTRSGPFAEHVDMLANSHLAVLGVPTFRNGKTTVFAPPGVVMTRDSEIATVPELAAAVDAKETVCIAADTFRTATIAYRATQIRAWRVSDPSGLACHD